MGAKEDKFLKKLLATFKVEAEEHLKTLSDGLLDLEKPQDPNERATILETVYRSAHSLKGGARAVNIKSVEAICQALEGVLSELKAERIEASASLFDMLYLTVDTIEKLLSGGEKPVIGDLIQHLNDVKGGKDTEVVLKKQVPSLDSDKLASSSKVSDAPEAALGAEKEAEDSSAEEVPQDEEQKRQDMLLAAEKRLRSATIRISVDKLDPLLLHAEEMVAAKMAAQQRIRELVGLRGDIDLLKQRWTNVSSDLRNAITASSFIESGNVSTWAGSLSSELQDFLDWHDAYLRSLEDRIQECVASAERDSQIVHGMVDELIEDMKSVLTLPVSTLLEIFPRLARDLSRDLGKEVDLVIEGGDLEIDRRILEEMKDPLIHLVRNSIDHGIEQAKDRKRSGKQVTGQVTISVSRVGSNTTEIVVSDDGCGIDMSEVMVAAKKRGLIAQSEDETSDEQTPESMIFLSGVSTSPIVTSISGRGIGLAIVREKVEKVGGHVSFETTPGKGTTFRLFLPVTLATFRGIAVTAAGRFLVVPTAGVERVIRLKRDEIGTVENKETIALDGRTVPLVRLGDILEIPSKENQGEDSQLINVLVLRSGERTVAFIVDTVVAEREVLVKSLGKQLSRVRNIAGITMRTSGELVPILNVADLVRSTIGYSHDARSVAAPEGAEIERKSVLIAEDSITSRMMLKNILESSGYEVTTAVNGAEALKILRSDKFDLVVSDVEMPKLSGFELTSHIRSDENLSQLPVVLVTALETKEDKEKGIDVGADAYIVKSSFDQSDLLEVVQRLI
jgi:two-component system chemotaxis sensor kinase CheA